MKTTDSLDPTRHWERRADLRPCVREPGYAIDHSAAPFLKSNYGDELVRSPRMTDMIAEESMWQEK